MMELIGACLLFETLVVFLWALAMWSVQMAAIWYVVQNGYVLGS